MVIAEVRPPGDTDITGTEMAAHHIADDDLEYYALGRLSGPRIEPVEEHLLICVRCQNRLTQWDDYVHAMRAGLRALSDQRAGGAGGSSAD